MMRAIKFMGVFAVIFTLTALVRADETAGTVKTVDAGRHEIVLKGLVKDTTYDLAKDAAVSLDGFKTKLADLRADDTAHITYAKKGDRLEASQVRALRKAKETTGTVRGVFSQKNEVTLKGILEDTTYELAKGGTVWIDNRQGTLADLREGDEVRITYQKRGDHLMAAEVLVTKRK